MREEHNSVHRTKSAMEYWAVSDLAPSKPERFAPLAREQFGNESVARLMRKCKRTGGYHESTPISAGRVSLGMETRKAVSDRHASVACG
jgi:hypothetical protein